MLSHDSFPAKPLALQGRRLYGGVVWSPGSGAVCRGDAVPQKKQADARFAKGVPAGA